MENAAFSLENELYKIKIAIVTAREKKKLIKLKKKYKKWINN